MPTERYDRRNGVFVLSEPGKAITFIPANHVISIHSDQPWNGLPEKECEYAGEAGYCDGSFGHGDDLRRRWEESGRFNDVVWDELHRWFDRYFPNTD